MRFVILGFFLGIVIFVQLPDLPSVYWSLFLALLPLAWRWSALRLPAAIAVGFCWAWLHAAMILSHELPRSLEGKEVLIQGRIDGLPQARGRGMRFIFHTQQLVYQGEEFPLPGRVRLNWFQPPQPLRAGQRWQLRVRLKRPHGLMNPGGFDYEAWLFQHALRATGYVRQGEENRLIAEGGGLHAWRQFLGERLMALVPARSEGALLLGLAVGDRSRISPAQWQVLRDSGTSHLLAISGLHIGLLAGMAFFVVRALWAAIPALTLRLASPRAAALAAILAAIVYAALAGFSVPTQRAMIMVVSVMALHYFQRPLLPMHSLGLALLAVLIWDPLAVLSPGFWLSFAAVALIFYAMRGRQGEKGWWWRWGRVQWVLALGLFPFLALWFQQVPLVSPLANLIAVPLVGLLVVPLMMFSLMLLPLSTLLAGAGLELAATLLAALWQVLQWLLLPELRLWLASPPWWTVVLALIGLFHLLAPRGLPLRWLGLFWLLPLLCYRPPAPPPGWLQFTLLDVGQGLSAVVRTHEHTLVFDTGARFSRRFDMGEVVVLPFLRQQGIDKVDTLMISHGDGDHIGGAAALIAAMPVLRRLSAVPQSVPGAQACVAGMRWQWEGVMFEVIHPPPSGFAYHYQGDNNRSCVLRVSSAGASLLLSGDIEEEAEAYVVQTRPEALAADILIAPHHGSKTSSSEVFIAAVSPHYVLYPLGYRNRYGFPHESVVARYRRHGVEALDVANLGAIEVILSPQGVERVRGYRQQRRRLWHDFRHPALSVEP